MIERHIAAQQTERFAGLDWYPREGAALRELVKAMQTAPSEAAAEFITTELIRDARECPKPADLYRLIGLEKEKRDNISKNCPVCNGTGFIIVERNGLTGARDCECRKAA
jgi:hypothetical protein